MAETIRTFIALELDNSIQKFVYQIQNDLKNKIDGKIAWVKPENAHITLKFLGDITPDQVNSIIEVLNTIQLPKPSDPLTVNSLGVFPLEGPPKIIWFGFKDADNYVQSLFTEIENKLSVLGFAKETRAFQNHLTLGRIKSLKNISALQKLIKDEKLVRKEKFQIKHITLFKSTLNSGGAVYTPIKKYLS